MTEIIWTPIGPGTEAVEVWERTKRGKRVGSRPLFCLVRTFHRDGDLIATAIERIPLVTLAELRLGGHP